MFFIKSKKKTYYNAYAKYNEMSNEKREFERALLEADSKVGFILSIIFSLSITLFNSFEYGVYANVKYVPPVTMILLAWFSVTVVLNNGLRLEALKRVDKEKGENFKKEP